MARRRVVAGVVVAVVVVGLGAYLLTRDGGITLPGIDPGPETPTLAFDRVRVIAVPTTETTASDIDVEGVAGDAEALLTDFYQQVWIDPDVWGGGDYTGVFDEVMSGGVIEAAQNDLEALTLGPAAGDTYEFVQPTRSTLLVDVLTDDKDHAAQLMAQVVFTASAEHTDGSYTDITQTATYFLADEGGDWRIISYKAKRAEVEGEAPASASASTPTAEAS